MEEVKIYCIRRPSREYFVYVVYMNFVKELVKEVSARTTTAFIDSATLEFK